MKLNKFLIVAIILLAIISLGAVSASSDNATSDGVFEASDMGVSASDDCEIDGNDIGVNDNITSNVEDSSINSEVYDGSKLSTSNCDDELSAGSITPDYTIEVTPNVMSGENYVAQYGEVITVKGDFGNATGNVSIDFGYYTNYQTFETTLVDGKFTQNLTNYIVRNNQEIIVKYKGDDYYKPVTWQKNIHIQLDVSLVEEIDYGQYAYIITNLHNATGNVYITTGSLNHPFEEKTYSGKLENGVYTCEFTRYSWTNPAGIEGGGNFITLYYEGDDRFNPLTQTYKFYAPVNIDCPDIYYNQSAIVKVYLGRATGKVNFTFYHLNFNDENLIESYEVDLINGYASAEFKNYTMGGNPCKIQYSGDDKFEPFSIGYSIWVWDTPKATISSVVYQTSNKCLIFINIPDADGVVNVTVNGKKEVWEIVNGTVTHEINASDVITELNVSYGGNYRLKPNNSSSFVFLKDNIITGDNFEYYFNQKNRGKLFDYVDLSVPLDFQGSITNPDSRDLYIDISKPVNVISSTGDAFIDLNTVAGSLLGENPGNRFAVSYGGAGSNITGIYLHNTQLWISNTSHVVFDNISVVVEDQRVGSGVGATSVRDNSSYVTLKNSYFYTRNNGGSSTFTFSWTDHCVFDNNTVKAEGNVGNLLYLNVYNIENLPGDIYYANGSSLPSYPLNTNNVFSNNDIYGKEGSAISLGIMVEGKNNLIVNNTLHKCSISTSFGGTHPVNNTYIGNILEEGSNLNVHPNSIVYNNIVPGTSMIGENCVVYNNTGGKMVLGSNCIAYDNVVGELMLNGYNASFYDNIVNGDVTVKYMNNIFHDNNVTCVYFWVEGASKVYENTIGKGTLILEGNNVLVFNNTINDNVIVQGNDAYLYNNVMGDIEIQGKTAIFHDNIANGFLKLGGDNNNIYNNYMSNDQPTTISGNNNHIFNNTFNSKITIEKITKVRPKKVYAPVNNNTFENNTVKARDDYAISIHQLATNNTFENNRLYALGKSGDAAVLDEGENSIEGNCPLKNTLRIVSDDINVGEALTVYVSLDYYSSETIVKVMVNGEMHYVLYNQQDSVTIRDLPAGEYAIIAMSDEFGDYGQAMNSTIVKVSKFAPVLNINVTDAVIGEDVNVSAIIVGATGDVTFIVDGVESNVGLIDGVANYTIANIAAGNHSIVAIYNGDAKNEATYASTSIFLNAVASEIADLNVDGDLNIQAVLKDITGNGIENATIIYRIGTQNATVTTDANGTFSIIGEANAKVEIKYEGTNVLLPSSASITLSDVAPTRVSTNISASKLTCFAVDTAAGEKGALFKVTLKDASDNLITNASVQFALNGVIYNAVSDSNGVASMQVNINKANTYTCAVSYLGDVKHDASFTAVKVVVNKKKTALTAKAKAFKVKTKTKKYTVTLKTTTKSVDGKAYLKAGKKVTITVGGKTYTAKTNSKGQATFKITKLNKKGKYNAVIKFAGDNTYNAVTKKVKISVK